LSIIVILTAIVVFYITLDPFTPTHLTDEYEVNKSLAEITKTNESLSVDGNKEIDSIYMLESGVDEEKRISSDSEVTIDALEPTLVTIIGQTKNGNKYILDTIEFTKGTNIFGNNTK
jgi:hypothetical protein